MGPDHRNPGAELPGSWRHTVENEITDDWSDLSRWWYQFEDDTLDGLMDEAVAQNLGLEEAAYRVVEARFQRGVVRSNLFPQISNDGAYTFQKTAIQGGFFGQVGGGFGGIDVTIDDWQQAFNGAWQVDVWGRLRRNVEAAEADTAAFVWNYRDTMIILLADVATNYVDARAFQERLEVAEENLLRQRRSLEIAESRQRVGAIGLLDVEQSRANLYTTEAEIPSLRVGYQQAVNRLSVLLGRPPGYVDTLMAERQPIPRPPSEIAVGIPAELLRRRPDIQRAERELAAQTARIGVAEADLYPQFSITGSFGLNSQDLSQIYTGNAIQATVGPSFSWNILNFGQIRFNIRVQEARAAQNVLRYQAAVLRAAEEVDNSLVAYAQEKLRLRSLQQAVTANESAAELVRAQRRANTVDELRVIDAERQLFASQDQLVVSKANITKNLIQVYRALGGGWEWSAAETVMRGVVEAFPEIEEIEPGADLVPPGEEAPDAEMAAEPGATETAFEAPAELSSQDSSRQPRPLPGGAGESKVSPRLEPPVRVESESTPGNDDATEGGGAEGAPAASDAAFLSNEQLFDSAGKNRQRTPKRLTGELPSWAIARQVAENEQADSHPPERRVAGLYPF